MRVYEHGTGEEYITVVGGTHGDEPMTAEVVEDINRVFQTQQMSEYINGRVKLLVANEKALDRDVRYTETDLNRTFPGNPNSDVYEERLAAEILDEVGDSKAILSLHSTHSAPPPFAISSNVNKNVNRTTICSLPVDYVVDTSKLRGTTMDTHLEQTVTVEIGQQKTESARNFGYDAALSFLRGHGYLSDKPASCTRKRLVTALREVKKSSGEPRLHHENFDELEVGTIIAEDDGVQHVAERENLTPVLMSEYGYPNIFGLVGEFCGYVEPVSN